MRARRSRYDRRYRRTDAEHGVDLNMKRDGAIEVPGASRGGGRARRRARPVPGAAGVAAWVGLALLLGPPSPHAQEVTGGVLAECAVLSPRLDDIHACLDDYLGVMDEEIEAAEALVEGSLDGAGRRAFTASRRAFSVYRRDNCLWYLEFSEPRVEAEQIAKDCLATMSLQRLAELRRLITVEDGRDAVQRGYYVYGDGRNTFRPCGSDSRLWVEGEASIVDELQQLYLDVATSERQLLFGRLRGVIDPEATGASGHDGVLRASVVGELRVPREGDCRLPAGVPGTLAGAPIVESAPAAADEATPPAEPAVDLPPDEQLTAYFGDWTADCVENRAERFCTLSTALLDEEGERAGGTGPDREAGEGAALALERRAAERASVALRFPGREIDMPEKIRWRVDENTLGDIVGSAIRVDATATRQLIEEPRYLRQELLPRLIAGGTLTVDVLESVDDERGERFSATLMGLTRALAFADDFVRDGG